LDTDIELENYFQSICNGEEGNPLDYLSQLICPHLVGKEWVDIRKAGLMMLLTQNESQNKTRMRLHSLLVGKPGTGKTEYLFWWRENLQGILINAELCSKTGLVGDARGHRVTAGLLADYDGNFVLADELDKMPMRDQNGLLQAMEEGQYIIVKGKHRTPFKAEVRIIGSTNEISKIQKPLLDRFDFVYSCKTATREERADQVSKIVHSFMGKDEGEYASIVKGYVDWLGNFDPVILSSDDLREVISMIKKYILRTHTEIDEVSYRSLECSILRIAWAMAKIRKKNIEKQDVIEAIIFKDRVLKELHGGKK
jgi:DNA replicative helicase MCM subunit Mcm2 (Cdc46/Mcm family)